MYLVCCPVTNSCCIINIVNREVFDWGVCYITWLLPCISWLDDAHSSGLKNSLGDSSLFSLLKRVSLTTVRALDARPLELGWYLQFGTAGTIDSLIVIEPPH